MKRFIKVFQLSSFLLLAGTPGYLCAASEGANQPNAPAVPQSWILPENLPLNSSALTTEQDETAATAALGTSIDRMFALYQKAVDQAVPATKEANVSFAPASDLVPWHMEFFTTDLSVTDKGKIGLLTVSGNPWVQAFWRRQNSTTKKSTPKMAEEAPADLAVALTDASGNGDLPQQVDAMVHAAMASGKVTDEANLRKNLNTTSAQFLEMVKAVESADAGPGSLWWVSRFRIDIIVSASGNVGTTPINVGGALRMRFEWQRIMKNGASPKLAQSTPPTPPSALATNLKVFIQGMKSDLEAAAAEKDPQFPGIFPYQVRMGLGMTVAGTIGLVKGSAEILGHIYFATNVTKPVVHPASVSEPMPGAVALIEKSPDPAHLQLAEHNNVPVEKSGDDVIYQITHEKFRAGLKKALSMGAFVAGHAASPTTSTWKLFQMYVGFDMSVTGTAGVVSLSGNSSDEIDFYNGNF